MGFGVALCVRETTGNPITHTTTGIPGTKAFMAMPEMMYSKAGMRM